MTVWTGTPDREEGRREGEGREKRGTPAVRPVAFGGVRVGAGSLGGSFLVGRGWSGGGKKVMTLVNGRLR